MKKKILLGLASVAALTLGVVGMSAFEAHVINVTAHIENALSLSTHGIDFGTVFPQEYMAKPFEILLSSSFIAEDRVDDVEYKLVQKDKPWTLNFGDPEDVNTHNRNLIFVDPETEAPGLGSYLTGGGVLTITTGTDIEDLFGQNEVAADWTAPRMMIPMGGNFTIETKVSANPMDYPGDYNAYQSGGILVYQSNGNVVRLELTRFTGLGPANAVYMESQIAAVKTGKAWSAIGEQDYVWLRLSRNGDTFSGEFSLDGVAWSPVTLQEGNFVNAAIGDNPQVGLAVTDNNENGDEIAFSADFDYITFNGNYLSLCKFLSKTNDDEDGQATPNDISRPSYFVPEEDNPELIPAHCLAQGELPEASGILSRLAGDIADIWNVDLKVPPVVGYIGQDWPESCAEYVVPENEADYGCDIWVEVTGISESEPRQDQAL